MPAPVEGLLVTRRGSALWLVLDRPARRNALTLGMARAVTSELEALADDVRCVVLTGTPPAFCAGGDLDELATIANQGADAITEVVYGTFQRLVTAIAAAPVPVLAGVTGAAAGGGCDLALWCDLRVASTEAFFVSSWIDVGLVPGMGGAHLLTEVVGSSRAAELVLLGRRLDAGTALAWGLVNEVVPPDALEERLLGLAAALAEKPVAALREAKAALRRARDATVAAELVTLSAVQGNLATAEGSLGTRQAAWRR